ncbi:MAG: signal peptidase II [Candidatus Woesearchaeota archaeon]
MIHKKRKKPLGGNVFFKIKLSCVYLIGLLIVILDQLSKSFIRLYQPNIEISTFFHIKYVTNTGAAFGILQDMPYFLAFISIIIIGVIIYYLPSIENRDLLPVSLILGGAVGNLIDRVLYGAVTDFIAIGWWPTFNIADSALSIGVIWILINIVLYDQKK